MKGKKRLPILLGILFVAITVTVGVSFAIWQIMLQQESTNVITTGCFEVAFTDANPINLEKAYLITDEEGKTLTPYEFTITNTCDSLASFQINLEVLNTTTLTDLSYIKSNLNESTKTISPKLLTTNETVTKTLEDANNSYKLQTGYLNANESKTYNLRLWLDENTPTEDAYMNKTFESKVTVTTSYLTEADTEIPIANFTTTRNETGVVVDASSSTDNKEIATYYYSIDGKNFTPSKENSHTFTEGSIEYGVGTNTISKLYSSKVNEVYVYVEDSLGNQSEVKKQTIGDLAYDETTDNNLRYIGANPSNYVYFNCDDPTNPTKENCELWRVIGVMNNIDDGTGTKETRIKLIRNESIGNYSWDSSTVNNGGGINEWSQADAMKLLNPGYDSETVGGSLYWNRGSGSCYNGQNNATTACDFTTSGLKATAKSMVGEAVWNTGANGSEYLYNNILTSKFYELERSTNNGKICTSGTYCTDTVSRTTTWTGKVGLMYPSDYGYATSGGTTTNRENCLNTILYSWQVTSVSDCRENDWLYKSGTHQWMLSPISQSSNAHTSFHVTSSGLVLNGAAFYALALSPVLYLNTSVKIASGEGTMESPFVLSLE